jgi:hypothetical protein
VLDDFFCTFWIVEESEEVAGRAPTLGGSRNVLPVTLIPDDSSGIRTEQPYEWVDHAIPYAHNPRDNHASPTIISFPSHIESKMKE